jgi:hypothetical protein
MHFGRLCIHRIKNGFKQQLNVALRSIAYLIAHTRLLYEEPFLRKKVTFHLQVKKPIPNKIKLMRFKFLAAASMKMTAFWDMAP